MVSIFSLEKNDFLTLFIFRQINNNNQMYFL
jgi:hypothetical protein